MYVSASKDSLELLVNNWWSRGPWGEAKGGQWGDKIMMDAGVQRQGQTGCPASTASNRLSACLGELGEALQGAGPRELCRQQEWGLGEDGKHPKMQLSVMNPRGARGSESWRAQSLGWTPACPAFSMRCLEHSHKSTDLRTGAIAQRGGH